MSTMDYNAAWAEINRHVSSGDNSLTNKMYTDLGVKYDECMDSAGYVISKNVTAELMKHVRNETDSTIIDIAAGTGKCGLELKKHHFRGALDALEQNETLLTIAKSRGSYRNYIQCGVHKDTPLPVPKGSYDAAICVGAMVPGHISPECVVLFVKVLKPGGILAFNCRDIEDGKPFKTAVERNLSQMVHEGVIERIDSREILHYKENPAENAPAKYSMLYIYRKL